MMLDDEFELLKFVYEFYSETRFGESLTVTSVIAK